MAELSLYPSLYRSLPKQGNPCLHSSHLRLGNCLSVRRVGLGAEGLVVGRFGTNGIRCSRQQISQRKIESPRALGVHSRHIQTTPRHPPAPPPPAPARVRAAAGREARVREEAKASNWRRRMRMPRLPHSRPVQVEEPICHVLAASRSCSSCSSRSCSSCA